MAVGRATLRCKIKRRVVGKVSLGGRRRDGRRRWEMVGRLGENPEKLVLDVVHLTPSGLGLA
jgi:hypothetical protein